MASGTGSLDNLPWACSSGSAVSFDRDVVRLSNKEFQALSKSAPNLNFDETELFEDFAEPCFHTQEFPISSKRTSTKTNKRITTFTLLCS